MKRAKLYEYFDSSPFSIMNGLLYSCIIFITVSSLVIFSDSLKTATMKNISEDEREYHVFPSSVLVCDSNSDIILVTGHPILPKSYDQLKNIVRMHATAIGIFKFKCVSPHQISFINVYIHPLPFAFRGLMPLIYPRREVYKVGDIVHCESRNGYSHSIWQFLWSSKDSHIPKFLTLENKLEIDVDFLASVVYIFTCDGDYIRFTVLREPYNVRIHVKTKIDGSTSLVCLSEGTNIAYIWHTYPNRVVNAITPSRGNTLHLDVKDENVFHHVGCTVISDYDYSNHVNLIINRASKKKSTPLIYAPKDFYFPDEMIECISRSQIGVTFWYCIRSSGSRTFYHFNNNLLLNDPFFSNINARYNCECINSDNISKISSDPWQSIVYDNKRQRTKISFFMRHPSVRECVSKGQLALQNTIELVTLLVIIISAIGPLRYVVVM